MDLMNHLVSRTDTTCTSGKLWYVCTAGDYKGCCSSNPCTSGVCPDDDDTATSSTTTKTTATSTSSRASSNTSTSKSSITENETISTVGTTSSSVTGSTSSTTITSATSTSSSPAASVSSSSGNHAAIIDGAIGGIAAFLIIVLLLFCFWKRRQRMNKTKPSIIDHVQRPSPGTMPRQIECVEDSGDGSTNPNRPGDTPELPDETARRMRAELSSDSQRGLINVPLNQRQGVMNYQLGGQANTPPRDFWGLSSTSSSPNLPNNKPNYGSGSVAGLSPPSRSISPRLMARNTARRIITEQGVVMGANLDRYSEDPRGEETELSIENWHGIHNGNGNGTEDGDAGTTKRKQDSWQSQDHVMSFMNFDGSLPLTDASDASDSHGDVEGSSPPLSPPFSFSASPPIPPTISHKNGNMSFTDVGPLSPTPSEVLPAYEAGEEGTEFEVNGERKTPAGSMGLGIRRFG